MALFAFPKSTFLFLGVALVMRGLDPHILRPASAA
jgi:hypothetical protein